MQVNATQCNSMQVNASRVKATFRETRVSKNQTFAKNKFRKSETFAKKHEFRKFAKHEFQKYKFSQKTLLFTKTNTLLSWQQIALHQKRNIKHFRL